MKRKLSLYADSEEVQTCFVKMLEEAHLLSNELFSLQEVRSLIGKFDFI